LGASVFAFALTPAAALAASPGSAAAQPAHAHAQPDSHPVPIIHHIVAVHTPAMLAHARRERRGSAIQRVRHSAARVVAQRHLVLLAPGSGYQQAAGSVRVRALQHRLASLGFAPGPTDGRYGPLTTQAVEEFQSGRGLTVDGIVGALTRGALSASPRAGLAPGAGYQQTHGSGRVRALQRRLAAMGFAPGPIDGRYGPLTTRAVERFQGARHLTVNGIVGAGTLRALGTAQRRSIAAIRPQRRPTSGPHPVAPEGHSIPLRSVTAARPPALPVTLVLLALLTLGLATISLSYGRARAQVRRKPVRGEQIPRGLAPEGLRLHDADGGNGGYRR